MHRRNGLLPTLSLSATLLTAVGCGDNAPVTGTLDVNVSPDAPPDTAMDVSAQDLGAPDAAPDVAMDVPPDIAPDVAADVAPDASADVANDVGPADVGPMCMTTERVCGGRCSDVRSDPANCGACGAACARGEVCAAGRCEIACPSSQSVCAGACVTLATDPSHCGSCDTRCPVGAACVMSVCACPSGQTACGGACVDTTSSRTHCGMCGRACAPSRAVGACVDGACRVVSCEAGLGDCDSDASNGCETDVRAAPAHCGGCGRACTLPHATAGCAAGACTVASCAAGFGDCDGDASNGCETDVRTSAAHCGGCGMTCGTGMCSAGVCLSAPSCLRLQMASPTLPSGRYRIDTDGAGPLEPFEVYCDMITDGGGWTYLATVTNNGDGPDRGSWLVASPSPNAWESTSASFGTLDPTANADYRSLAFHRVTGAALMITHRNEFLLRTDAACLAGSTLQAHFAARGWECRGSEDFSSHPPCTHACVIAQAVARAGDTALLNGAVRTRLYLKSGEADGAQDTNRDRSYLSTNYRPNVDYPVGLGTFCSGASCSPRAGEADVNNLSDAITPTAGTEFYGLWIR